MNTLHNGLNAETYIGVKYANGYLLPNIPSDVNAADTALRSALLVDMMKLGFIMSQEMYDTMAEFSNEQVVTVYSNLIPVLKRLVGADVQYKPMFPNFPEQVRESSELELFIVNIIHYMTGGQWLPEYEKDPRAIKFEHTKFKEINFISDDEYDEIGYRLFDSKESLSGSDLTTAIYFVDDRGIKPVEIPYKENMCLYAAHVLEDGGDIDHMKLDTTDILRIATELSHGDISLAEKTKFKSMSRPIRRKLTLALEKCIREEDINRHAGKWVKLFHSLHVGDYSDKVFKVAKKFRSNAKIVTWNSRVEAALKGETTAKILDILSERPSEFARRLDHVLRTRDNDGQRNLVLHRFTEVLDRVPSRIKLQLLGHFNTRDEDVNVKTFFPKAAAQRVLITKDANLKALDSAFVEKLKLAIRESLVKDFGKLPELGNVYIDPALKRCPLPTQMRSASESLKQMARGTRIPVCEDKNTLRFFIHWVGDDIDLSATFHDEDFEQVDTLNYCGDKWHRRYNCVHSGDITYAPAPHGASEFIDIDLDKCAQEGVKYVGMSVIVYCGDKFSEHDTCYAGWMEREHPNSNEVYDAKTVVNKVDLRSETTSVIPLVVDIENREIVWVDVSNRGGNSNFTNTHTQKGSIEDTVMAIINTKNKVPLADLFEMHTQARGQLVESPEDADTIFSLDEGVTPFDATIINSEFLVE